MITTSYLVDSNDLGRNHESFFVEIAGEYNVQASNYSSDVSAYKKQGSSFGLTNDKVFPISAGNHIGGSYGCEQYRKGGIPIDVALKGRRPIGIPVGRILYSSVQYLNRIGDKTYLSSEANSPTGEILEYNPICMHVELLGGGGGGAGSSLTYASGGGGAGGYCYATIEIPENSHLRISVGAGGSGGSSRLDGKKGEKTSIFNADNIELCYADGGEGGKKGPVGGGGNGGNSGGGILNIKGAKGGKKEHAGENVPVFLVTLDKPEVTSWTRGGTGLLYQENTRIDSHYGGAGGASVFADPEIPNRSTAFYQSEYGVGGAGGGFEIASSARGTDGGCGLVNLYY